MISAFDKNRVDTIINYAAGMDEMGCIEILILSYNAASDAGCNYVGEALRINNTLTSLELGISQIGDHESLFFNFFLLC